MTVLGVSRDSVAKNKAFAEKVSFNFKLLSDETGEMCLDYGATSEMAQRVPRRISYLIDYEGIVLKAYEHVSPKVHAGEVLMDLEALAVKD